LRACWLLPATALKLAGPVLELAGPALELAGPALILKLVGPALKVAGTLVTGTLLPGTSQVVLAVAGTSDF